MVCMWAAMARLARVWIGDREVEARRRVTLRACDRGVCTEQRHPRVLAIVVIEAHLARWRPRRCRVAAIEREPQLAARKAVKRIGMTRAAHAVSVREAVRMTRSARLRAVGTQ